MNPGYKGVYHNFGALLSELERYDEAEKAYRKAIEINPDDVYSYSNLGFLFYDLKRFDEAKQEILKARELFKKGGEFLAEEEIVEMVKDCDEILDEISKTKN
ncbi:MAG: hypothetical protein CVT88_03760 [Candidatus Altiarchaeales archaeon HGW-Altiarchaeales-1]|nr:MAG: hypothetical protein CVT88_03760 [Candidatus Altiarchaeales archaeon HGW-Altiarchaeales-1]